MDAFWIKVKLSHKIGLLWLILLLFITAAVGYAGDNAPDACGLLPRKEIQDILGAAPSGMNRAITFREGTTSICQGTIGDLTLTIRVSLRSSRDSANEATIARMITAAGGKVETVRMGEASCTTITPIAGMAAEYGYDSMCTIGVGTREVAVQSDTHRLAALVPAAKLRRLVALAVQRLPGQR